MSVFVPNAGREAGPRRIDIEDAARSVQRQYRSFAPFSTYARAGNDVDLLDKITPHAPQTAESSTAASDAKGSPRAS